MQEIIDMNVSEHYNSLIDKCKEISNETLIDGREAILGMSHSYIYDYEKWVAVLDGRPEAELIKIALREYQMALLCNVMGLYNQAYIGLRFFFERTLVAIMFSANEIDLRLWLIGDRDSYWREIVDENTGVFSHSYARAFFIDLKDEVVHYRRMAEKVYRECSEFVHGNMVAHGKIPPSLEFNDNLFQDWNNKASTIKNILLFALCLRYLKFMNDEQLKMVESTVFDEFAFISPIRILFGGTN